MSNDLLPTRSTLTVGRPNTDTHHALELPTPMPMGLSRPRPPHEAPPRPAAVTPITVLSLLRSLRRRVKGVVMYGLIAAAAAFAFVWLFLPPTRPYATAKLYFPTKPQNVLFEHPDPPLNQLTQKELVTSRMILRKAIAEPGIAELETIREFGDPSYSLSKELQVDFPQASEIMRLTLPGDRPEELKPILDAIKNAYMREVFAKSSVSREERQNKLTTGLAEAEERLTKEQNVFRAVVNEVGSSDPQVIAFRLQSVDKDLNKVREDLFSVQIDISTLEKAELEAKKKQADNPSAGGNQPYRTTDPEELASLRKLKAELDLRLSDRRRVFPEDHPSVQELAREVATVEERLGGARSIKLQNGTRLNLDEIQGQLITLHQEETKLKARLQRATDQAESLKKATSAFETARNSLKEAEANYNKFTQTLDKLRFEFDAPAGVQPMEETSVVRPSDFARRLRTSIMGAVAMAGLVTLLIGFLEFRQGRLDTVEQAQLLGVPILGALPRIPNANRTASAAQRGPLSAAWETHLNEAIDSIRTIMLHQVEKKRLQTILIAAADDGEGKSSIAFRLACSLARSGRKTLLIDGDLRHPEQHQIFEMPLSPGISEMLKEPVDVWSIMRGTPQANLWVMSAGKVDRLALEQLAQGKLDQIFEELRSSFDLIIIDSSPLIQYTDALLMAKQCDAVYLTMRCDVSRVERVRIAQQRLTTLGKAPLGAIINGSRDDSYGDGLSVKI